MVDTDVKRQGASIVLILSLVIDEHVDWPVQVEYADHIGD